MAIQMVIANRYDLQKPLQMERLAHELVMDDSQADIFRVEVTDGDNPVSLAAGNVQAYFIRADQYTVVIQGMADSNAAVVTLPASCYTKTGRFTLTIKVTHGDVRRTVYCAEGVVRRSTTDALVDPEATVPSLDELLAQIATIEDAVARANEAADAAQEFVGLTVQATTLPTGQAATANFANGVLTLGLPRGEKGDTGSASAMKVNGIEGIDDNITITGGDIPRSSGSSQTIAAALTEAEEAAAEAAQAAQEAAAKPAYTPNLLDNSDFVHPVNQRKQESYAVNGYTIDRWRTWADTATVELTANGMVTGGTLYQYLQIDPDATYTAAVCRVDGIVVCVSGTPRAGMRLNPIAVVVGGNGLVTFTFTAGSYRWAALYKGAYTPSTLPLYVPKGRAAELAECMRYYQVREMLCKATGWDRYDIGAMINMRITPTVALKQFTNYGTGTITDMTGCTLNLDEWYIHYATLPTVSDHYDNGTLHAELSADL